MKRSYVIALAGVVAVSAAACGQGGSSSGEYPTKNIEIIVPYAAGGTTDSQARALAPCMEESLGRSVITLNRPGGGGVTGVTEFTNAEPDGHTLGIVAPATAAVAPLTEGATFEQDSFTYVGVISQYPSVVVVKSDNAANSFEELIANAGSENISISNGGASTTLNIGMTELQQAHDLPIEAVPFNSGAEGLNAMQGGNVDAYFGLVTPGVFNEIEAGTIKALVVSGEQRPEYLPDVATFAEQGFEDILPTGELFTLAGPKGMETDVTERLSSVMQECMNEQAVKDAVGERYVSPTFLGSADAERLMAVFQTAYQNALGS